MCSFSTVASGRPESTSAQTASASTPAAAAPATSASLVAQLTGPAVAVLEQGVVDGEELLGLGVADGHADLQGEEAAVGLGASHTAARPSSTWAWPSEKGRNVTSQSAPARSPSRTCSWAMRANGQR